MKKSRCVLLFCIMVLQLSGCSSTPNSLQMDLSRGYGEHLKLLHLNASTSEKRERIQAFSRVILEAEPLDKSLSMFAYYPDYLLEITPWEGGKLTVIVDINGEYVDFYYPGPNPEGSGTIYRSNTSAAEFKRLIHHA